MINLEDDFIDLRDKSTTSMKRRRKKTKEKSIHISPRINKQLSHASIYKFQQTKIVSQHHM